MMYLIRLSIFISILFHSIFSAYLFNPENIALSEASSIAYDDFRSINPAYPEGVMLSILFVNVSR